MMVSSDQNSEPLGQLGATEDLNQVVPAHPTRPARQMGTLLSQLHTRGSLLHWSRRQVSKTQWP